MKEIGPEWSLEITYPHMPHYRHKTSGSNELSNDDISEIIIAMTNKQFYLISVESGEEERAIKEPIDNSNRFMESDIVEGNTSNAAYTARKIEELQKEAWERLQAKSRSVEENEDIKIDDIDIGPFIKLALTHYAIYLSEVEHCDSESLKIREILRRINVGELLIKEGEDHGRLQV